MLTHTGEEQYKCEICQLKFAQIGDLKKYMQSYPGEMRFEGENCK